MLLVLDSAVFLGSESLGTRDHILLSQIWDFPFRRLLRLAGSRWRYSTPLKTGKQTIRFGPRYIASARTASTVLLLNAYLMLRSLDLVAIKTCSQSHSLASALSSDSTVLALSGHVTVLMVCDDGWFGDWAVFDTYGQVTDSLHADGLVYFKVSDQFGSKPRHFE
jgi:hypothetical protein